MGRRLHVLPLLATLACADASAGDPTPSEGSEGPATTSATSEPPTTAPGDDTTSGGLDPSIWLCPQRTAAPSFELGWDYKDGWIDLEQDGPVTIIVGGQGAWMVPIGVRGEGFCVPADPFDYDRAPVLEIRIEAEGFDEPIAAVYDFPVSFEPNDDGELAYTFIPMILTEAVPVEDFEGVPTSIRSELVIRDGTTLSFTLDGTLTVSE